jgi:transcriptional regulator of met regulon
MLVPHDATTIGILSDERARRRAHSRTDAVKAELVAAAWHPKRMLSWCLDETERREMAEMGL